MQWLDSRLLAIEAQLEVVETRLILLEGRRLSLSNLRRLGKLSIKRLLRPVLKVAPSLRDKLQIRSGSQKT